MTNAQTNVLVVKDNAGNYFVLPQELLERGRVPAEHTAEIEHLIAEQQDVQGYRIAWAWVLTAPDPELEEWLKSVPIPRIHW